MIRPLNKALSVLMLSTIALHVFADAKDAPTISSKEVTGSIYLLSGKGGNLGVSIGDDGTFLIDDKFAPMTDAILKEIKSLGGDVPKFVVNTHWHGDHTGGNENLGKKGSVIVAHDNVRKRLSQDSFLAAFNKKTKAQPKAALPVITFTQAMTFHLNGDTLEVIHLPNGHTDGDSIIHFKKANVLHTGDLFFNGFYPFIDVDHGGSLKGMLNAVNKMLLMVNQKTQIIPGHGPMANQADLERYRDMLKTAYGRLKQLNDSGKNVKQAIAAKPLKDLDAKWSGGLFKTDRWIELIYKGLG